MKLVWIIGDTAVGKMTVGQELMKITDLRLFHNHMTIEPVIEVFGSYQSRVTARLREVIFEEFAASHNYGMIFTYMWAFDAPSDWEYVRHVSDMFAAQGADIYFVELVAPQEVRLQRNITENRLSHKSSKRDTAFSNQRLLDDDLHHRCVSYEGEIPFENYLRIENADIPADRAAQIIKDRFHL